MTSNYAKGGALEVFFSLSEEQALVRPVTPGYPVVAKIFEKALADIADGADVSATLDAAVDEIDADIEANKGYGQLIYKSSAMGDFSESAPHILSFETFIMAKSLTRQSLAGWLFAGPAIFLIVLFLIVPFFMAVGFNFTNQRLVSPNPTEYVGTKNYERLFEFLS